MDLSKQVDLLNSINILPIKLRFLRNFIKFLNSNLSNLYIGLYFKLQKNISPRTNPFRFPIFKTKHNKFSLSSISIKILNLFLFNYTVLLSKFELTRTVTETES
jgi:hypothetical protein